MTGVSIPVIETARLRLRAPQASDLPAYSAFRGSERARVLGGPWSEAEAFDQMCALIGHWQLRGFGRWMVADKATDAPLGVVGIMHPPDWPEPEIGWSVFADAEGRGVAFEAALATRDYAYRVLGWQRVVSLIVPGNTRSERLAERLGCRRDANFPHPDFGSLTIWVHPGPEGLA
jgi:ribosomal-protein-alanine N-acetyltransferase